MTEDTEPDAAETDEDGPSPTALLIIPGGGGKSENVLAKYLQMHLEFRYGLEVERITNVRHVVKLLQEHPALHSVFLIQGGPVSVNATVPILTGKGRLPLFILQPKRIATEQKQQLQEVAGVFVGAWESAFGKGQDSLGSILEQGMAGVGDGDDPEARVRQRLKKLDSLPTLPTVLGRLMRMVRDPDASATDLEVLLTSEPSIALKLRQVANSAAIAGASGREVESLKEAITRLGMKKVGAIAQQLAVINSLVKPEDNGFDLRQYWGHSLACAIVADKICTAQKGKMKQDVPFNDYWIAALLHDCGKAVQGFFFYDWFEQIIETMEDDEGSFYDAEASLGEGMVMHDRIGEMVLQKAELSDDIIEAVGLHHDPGDKPSVLTALVHVANGMCSEMGFGYHDGSTFKYARPALQMLGMKRETVRELVEELQEPVGKALMEVVSQCLGDQ